MRGIGSGNSEGRPPSRPSSQHGSKNRGSGESFDPATAFVVDLPLSEVEPTRSFFVRPHMMVHTVHRLGSRCCSTHQCFASSMLPSK